MKYAQLFKDWCEERYDGLVPDQYGNNPSQCNITFADLWQFLNYLDEKLDE